MPRFDVYAHPDAGLRKHTPYLVDIQNNYISTIGTRAVLPMRAASAFSLRMRDLNPVFNVGGKDVVLDTAAIGAIPVAELKKPVMSLKAQSATTVAALDTLFESY
ncbi:MAG: CcdB family protein [Bdellovibrionales bacterium]|nr:CcdB family protein [Ramlibacter sp.]